MPKRRRAGLLMVGVFSCAGVAALAFCYKAGVFKGRRPAAGAQATATAEGGLDQGLRSGDAEALATLLKQLTPNPDASTPPANDEETEKSRNTLLALRAGYLKFQGPLRASVITAACRVFDRFTKEPAPARWVDALQPLHDLITAGLSDTDPNPRRTALAEIAKLWVWVPGRTLMPTEEQALAEWKGAFHPGVVRSLASRDINTRIAAVACLGALPIDEMAAPGVPYIDDENLDVRKQTLVSYARRSLLLTVDMLLTRMNDADPSIQEVAGVVLKARGLTQEQISLGALIFSPRPAQRVSVIPLLKDRTDLDPVIWLIQLTHDPVESVRLSAVEALAAHKTPLVERRLTEMARGDASIIVRSAAGKLLPTSDEKTAALPPLPATGALNPKAN